MSSESLKGIVGDRSLYDALHELGVSGDSTLFRIEVEEGGAKLEFLGWVSVSIPAEKGELHSALVR
jgi:hypothetical protein